VIFALSNPDPEIDPDVAIAAGAAYAGDGRSINNALAFPGIFKGALDVRASASPPDAPRRRRGHRRPGAEG
jgi:malate dehydrogenase (oxaloacetate-decarboxylating)